MKRNYNTISPSAKALLQLKGLTNIPFAREAAELIIKSDQYKTDYNNKDVGFWAKVVHFEKRYWSIDQLLNELSIQNIVELSSGFSFRGLDTIRKTQFHYIDTDLPDVIEQKKEFINTLQKEIDFPINNLETLALNALDENEFSEIVNHFPEGEIVIVNEGLLMYLDINEKEKLCSNIREILKERGGYWITADIYIKTDNNRTIPKDEQWNNFFEQHNIEENKFDSFAEAESFFKRNGFIIDKEALTDRSKLSSLQYLISNASGKELIYLRNRTKIQATWRLRLAD
jgi:O-methyltransferase involved in polyketide biosynthesis